MGVTVSVLKEYLGRDHLGLLAGFCWCLGENASVASTFGDDEEVGGTGVGGAGVVVWL